MIIQADGHDIEVCRIPSGLVKGYDDFVFSFQTKDLFQTSIYTPIIEKVMASIIGEVESELGCEVEVLKTTVHRWTPTNQISLVSLRKKEEKERE